MPNNVLMIGFHFPPAAMGSGHLRTLGFARYLPDYGWNPIILTATSLAYTHINTTGCGLIPPHCHVYRALALDARRHFGIAGRYPAWLAQPDRWASWQCSAIWRGLRVIRKHQVHAIWSTYPIMTAHAIANTLCRLTRLPWIADFRDPVQYSVSDKNPLSVASQMRWEQKVLGNATGVTFTSPGAMQLYSEKYPDACSEKRLSVIQNGYDEAAFAELPSPAPMMPDRPLRLVHSGQLYPEGRNPMPFFYALARLKETGQLNNQNLLIVLRASGATKIYKAEIERLGLAGMITLAPPVSYQESLAEQAAADGLLLFQGERYDRQIPAKLYEYLRIGRPTFALVGERGDTAALLRNIGGAELVPLDDAYVIEKRFSEFIHALREGRVPKSDQSAVQKYSRRNGAVLLANILNQVVA